MSLYYEAARHLENPTKLGGSLKSRVFGDKSLKHPAASVYALATKTVRWSPVLKEVVERTGLLKAERKVSLKATL
jgi:25S rRNA (cytosine2278-C5)-methyltransferase